MKTSASLSRSRWCVMNSDRKCVFPAVEPEPTIYLWFFPQVNAGLLMLMIIPVLTSSCLNHIHSLSHLRPPFFLCLSLSTHTLFVCLFENSHSGHYLEKYVHKTKRISFESIFLILPLPGTATPPYYLSERKKESMEVREIKDFRNKNWVSKAFILYQVILCLFL